jgi:endonuclease III
MKQPFDVDVVMERIAKAVRPFPKAALFELVDEGFGTPFEILIACVISIRTRDETTLVCARRLFALARTPEAMNRLSPERIEEAIRESSFRETKSWEIREIARRVVAGHHGDMPCDEEVLLSFPGVGPKCANLMLGIACGETRIGVDVHVHRVTNRFVYALEKTPEKTMVALEAKLPKQYWVEINRLLVPFGKHVCTRVRPKCSTCPVLDMCRQVGVTEHR